MAEKTPLKFGQVGSKDYKEHCEGCRDNLETRGAPQSHHVDVACRWAQNKVHQACGWLTIKQ